MEKAEVIVDTCFLQKISSGGKKSNNILLILDEFGFVPVAHPYICEHELSLNSYSDNMIKSGYIRKVEYIEFLKDDYDKKLYESYFHILHEDMRLYLEARGGVKQIDKLCIYPGKTIYDTHFQGSSMGDVHMILMAAFMRLPIILTEDSDIELLSTLVRKRLSFGDFRLTIYNSLDIVKRIAENPKSKISKDELIQILYDMGERAKRSEVKTIWNEHHSREK